MDFSYLKDTLDQSNRYKDLALWLTNTIESLVRHSDMDPYDKYQLVKSLIAAHEENPCLNSAEWVAQWRVEFKDLLKDADVLELSDLPY